MENFSLDISGAISTGWEYAKKYGLLVAVIYLIVSMLNSGMQQVMGPSISPDVYQQMGETIAKGDMEALAKYAELYNGGFGSSMATFLGSLIQIIVEIALWNLALGLMSGRFSEVTFDAFKLPFAVYLKAFVVDFLVGIICIFATLLCIVPVFFVAPRLVLAPVYQVAHPEAGIMDSIKASWNMTSGNTFSMLGLSLALVGINILGFFCCCIGIYFTEAIALFATVAAFNQLGGSMVAAETAADGYVKSEY